MIETLMAYTWFFPILALLLVISIYIFDEDGKIKSLSRNQIFQRLKKYRVYVFLLFVIMFFLKVSNFIQDNFPFPANFTHIIYNIEGNSLIIALQQAIQNPIFIHSVSLFYLFSYPLIIVFTTGLFVLRDEEKILKMYIYAMVLKFMITIPCYIFLNVSVTSHYPPGTSVKPLLYQFSQYKTLILSVDRLTDNMPSGHIAIPFFVTLLTFFKTKLKRYKIFTAFVTAMTGFAIIYLGIHWLLDIVGGIVLGFLAYKGAVNNKKIRNFFDGIVGWLEKRI